MCQRCNPKPAFSLTPAHSRREREKRVQRLVRAGGSGSDGSQGAVEPNASACAKRRRSLFPFRLREDRGEREGAGTGSEDADDFSDSGLRNPRTIRREQPPNHRASANCCIQGPSRSIAGSLSLFLLLLTLLTTRAQTAPATAGPTAPPRDWRHRIPAAALHPTATNEWTSDLVHTPWSFDELVYAWHPRTNAGAFRLYLQAEFGTGDQSPWLYAGFWGPVATLVTNRQPPKVDRGILDMDWLRLTTKATGCRFRVVAAGATPLKALPDLSLLATDNSPPSAPAAPPDQRPLPPRRVLDIPMRRQYDSQGLRLIDRCQSAALASAMEYFGRSLPLEDITRHTFDPEYSYPGIWPRVIGAAAEFGFDGYLARFRNWDDVRRALADNQVLLCSMRMNAGDCASPPYRSMGNHIVALCGLTEDGRVVVTDSFLGRSGQGYLCQWLQSDFEQVWMKAKGGLAMVICPPPGAAQKPVKDLPPFPKNREFPTGDDH